MESIEVLTGQHVKIEYKSASIVDRILACLIDGIIKYAYLMIIFMIFSSMNLFKAHDDLLVVLFIVLLLPFFLFHFLFESLWGGRTPGKKILNIQVTNEDGTAIGIGGFFLRWLIRPIDTLFMGGVGIIFIIASSKNQRLGDMAAGTIVVKNYPKQQSINNDLYSFNADYQVKYPQAAQLTKGQVLFIIRTLEIPQPKNDYRDNEGVTELAEKVKGVLNIEEKGVSRTFLENIVRDYYYYDSLGI